MAGQFDDDFVVLILQFLLLIRYGCQMSTHNAFLTFRCKQESSTLNTFQEQHMTVYPRNKTLISRVGINPLWSYGTLFLCTCGDTTKDESALVIKIALCKVRLPLPLSA